MAQNKPVIPKNADKILFAEDFLYFMSQKKPTPYVIKNEEYRAHVITAFNDSVKGAVRIMDVAMVNHPLIKTVLARNVNEFTNELYESVVRDFHKFYFPYGFKIENFLRFCVPVIAVANHFYYNGGVVDAPKLAIKAICDVLKNYDMVNGGWEIVKKKAEECIKDAEN